MLRYLWIILFLVPIHGFTQEPVETPDKVYGELFRAVQLSRVFPDSKTFPDCIPLRSPSDILNSYRQEMPDSGFNLKRFVLRNFRLPPEPKPFTSPAKDLLQHISGLWEVLNRRADSVVEGSSLIPLPHAYIVPGGRFREIYYWDSYFTMLGLKEAHRYEQMENMVKNFAWLIREFGHIPNGNRSYYLSRSQPPFFASMVSLLASVLGEQVYLDYSKELWIEMKYWNEPASDTAAPRQVLLDINAAENYYLSRYHDDLDIPRQESYAEDFETANTAVRQFLQVVRIPDKTRLKRAADSVFSLTCNNLRTAAASGWDFSSRWMRGRELYTTNTRNTVPVDLNCLVFNLQQTATKSQMLQMFGAVNKEALQADTNLARTVFNRTFFNDRLGWFCDYNIDSGRVSDKPTLAGMFPLYFKLADKKSAARVADFLRRNFLKEGGVVTTLQYTGQQWDAPNGWAPLQWITVVGLENYGYHQLAKEIAIRWVNLNKKVFRETGKLMEKYDVVNLKRKAGGGEYPSQDGFGWTNGVLLALLNRYDIRP